MLHFEDGLHDISNAAYHGSDALSRSQLVKFKQSPFHYLNSLDTRTEVTPAMSLGSLVHTLVLEPNTFDERYHLITQKTRPVRTTPPWQKILEEAKGREIITASELETAQNMASNLLSDRLSMALLEDAKIEQSIFWTDEATGIQCKARPDCWNNTIVADVKTSADASPRAFQNAAWKDGYYLQAGMIRAALRSIGVTLEKFAFIVVENKAPYATATYVLDEEALDGGEYQFNLLLQRFKECRNKNEFPSYGFKVLSLPSYANLDE